MVTLKDIAQELNVSVPLVSKVLNNSRSTIGVSPKTAERIRETAKRLGYVRNRSARALSTGRQNAIGVLVHPWGALGSGLTEMLLEGVAEEAAAFDQHLELGFYRTSEEFHKAVARMHASSVDALIVAGVRHKELAEELLRIHKKGLPVVTMHTVDAHPDLPNVCCDEETIGQLATRHLIDQGCRRIAHLAIYPEREAGYRRALEEAGLPFDSEMVFRVTVEMNVSFQEGVEAGEYFLAQRPDFDGVFTQCDVHAIGVMRAMEEAGRRVPEDVKIIGIDDSPVCLYASAPLSSVCTQVPQRARMAVRMVMDAVKGEKLQSAFVPPAVRVRRSSDPNA